MLSYDVLFRSLYDMDLMTLNSMIATNSNISNYCNTKQFWINKFKHDNITIYGDPQTVNDYVEQYKLMIKAKQEIGEQLNKNFNFIEIKFRTYKYFDIWDIHNYDIIPNVLKLAINEKKLRVEKSLNTNFVPDKITIESMDREIFNVEYELLSSNPFCTIDTMVTMKLSEIRKFLIDARFVELFRDDSLNITYFKK